MRVSDPDLTTGTYTVDVADKDYARFTSAQRRQIVSACCQSPAWRARAGDQWFTRSRTSASRSTCARQSPPEIPMTAWLAPASR